MGLTTRRQMLFAGAALAGGARLVRAQRAPVFALGFDEAPVDEGVPLTIVVTASTPCTVRIDIETRQGPKVSSPELEIKERGLPAMASLPKGVPGTASRVNINVQPHGSARPSVDAVLGERMTVAQLETFLRSAPFRPDPARLHQRGAFTIEFDLEATVAAKIWRGDRTAGAPVLVKTEHHTPERDYVEWDLTSNGKPVPPGDYVALLTCTPANARAQAVKAVFYSSFRVEA